MSCPLGLRVIFIHTLPCLHASIKSVKSFANALFKTFKARSLLQWAELKFSIEGVRKNAVSVHLRVFL